MAKASRLGREQAEYIPHPIPTPWRSKQLAACLVSANLSRASSPPNSRPCRTVQGLARSTENLRVLARPNCNEAKSGKSSMPLARPWTSLCSLLSNDSMIQYKKTCLNRSLKDPNHKGTTVLSWTLHTPLSPCSLCPHTYLLAFYLTK